MHRRCFRIHPAQASTPQPADPARQGKAWIIENTFPILRTTRTPRPRKPKTAKHQLNCEPELNYQTEGIIQTGI
jgi:hypothetical protein